MHASGGTVIADYAGGEPGEAIFDEDTPVHPVPEKQPIRDVDLFVLGAAAQGVRTSVIVPAVVYGTGPGVRTESKKYPMLIEKSRKVGAGVYVGRGLNVWSNVHVDDLVDLFLIAAERSPAGTYYYAEDGETAQIDNARAISRGLGFEGRIASLPVDEAVREYGFMRAMMSFASNGRLRGKNARRILGWSPRQPRLLEYLETTLGAMRAPNSTVRA
jgi:nucleoside-diphosphate-sugar epimerase